ncbi:hypothetical protein RhiirA5_451732 [Rhizophagus irregularis]|uniref:ATP-dependent DNA helicase n=1 Tax=Rhizophagus irregularis TaxID=588596 RepID=A0A2N0P8Y6_9GLOM|nr:hypothetical protein RhiirA5_451732 [Rhizophagus irregularis]
MDGNNSDDNADDIVQEENEPRADWMVATTGVAAFNIQGSTIHSELSIPILYGTKYKIEGESLKKLQNIMKNIKYFIIDEISMYHGQTLTNLDGIPAVPNVPIRSMWEGKSGICSRLQFPFSLTWAIKVHKLQDLTLSKVVTDLDKREFAAGAYKLIVNRDTNYKKRKKIDDCDRG